jgi:hypothetical protein
MIEKNDKEALRTAGTRLLKKQFLYVSKQSDKRSYLVIADNLKHFERLFENLSRSIFIDRDMGYIALLPEEGARSISLKQDETLMLLCLRLIYEEGVDNFAAVQGAVTASSETITNRYATETRLEQPNLTRFREIMTLFNRHGIASAVSLPGEKNMGITISPGIRHVVNADYVMQMEECLGARENDTIGLHISKPEATTEESAVVQDEGGRENDNAQA